MADARLTALNPEDSSVVPVACDASGRLLLEEQGQGPPGPEGPPGPKGDDGKDGKDGDPFSGNFADDVTFGGSAEFGGSVAVGGPLAGVDGDTQGTFISTTGRIYATAVTGTLPVFEGFYTGSGQPTSRIKADGSVELADKHFQLESYGLLRLYRDENTTFPIFSWGDSFANRSNGSFYADGSATFAANKAGFTAEGYLWCTTRRGDKVVLDSTSNGLGVWEPYTPESRKEQIKEELDSLREETG